MCIRKYFEIFTSALWEHNDKCSKYKFRCFILGSPQNIYLFHKKIQIYPKLHNNHQVSTMHI